jgi:two-component system, OmpR family, phosphate regulon sensor histidine kinase PhoR
MTNVIIRRVIVLGAISILSLLAVQTYWIMRTWDLQEREFNRKANQALLDVANDMAQHYQFKLPQTDIVEQLYSNYYVVNLNNNFQATTLEYYLQKQFDSQGMQDDFQYGIFDCSSNQMISGGLVKHSKSSPLDLTTTESLNEPLPAHQNVNFVYYFGVRFPGKNASLLSSMWIVVVFSVLMLITIAFFIYAMFVILRQKQLSEQQRDFINNMTHEFKTPISTINISTDVFLTNPTIKADPRLSRYSSIIKEQVTRLNNQVEKVLQVAKIDRQTVEFNFEHVDIVDLLRSITPSMELKTNEKNGSLHLDIDVEHVFVRADQLHLTNILHNLVDNGVKYAKDAPVINIRLRTDDKYATLMVEDNGIGISKEHQRRVFDKFYRVPTGNVHNVKGFGLGLFYVKEICKEHRWKLDLQSEPGKGTSVIIRMAMVDAPVPVADNAVAMT